jgi:chemotaxis protein CheC
MANIEELNSNQLDALQETGNIGCSHAATAVSQMIGKSVNISVPNLHIKKVVELKQSIHELFIKDEKVVGVYLELTKEFLGSILFLFPMKSALNLADLLVGQQPGTSQQLDDMGKSAITEVGNIVVSAYTNALGKLLNTTVWLSPPKFEYDMPGAVIDIVSKNLGPDTNHALIFDIKFTDESNLFTSIFILLPSPQSLDVLLSKLIPCISNECDDTTKQYIESLSKNTG